MPLLGFKAQFAPAVKRGEKRQTVRALRKRPFRAGDRLFLYVGLRTKGCRKIGEATCQSAAPVFVYRFILSIDGERKDRLEREAFAIADGFGSFAEFAEFIAEEHGLPFEGQVVKW